MKTFRLDFLNHKKNGISAELYLEFAVHLIEFGFFEPLVFCHDEHKFDIEKYKLTMKGFFNLLMYLDSCGMRIVVEKNACPEYMKVLYMHKLCTQDEADMITGYEVDELDFTDMHIESGALPIGCSYDDFALVVIYLILRTGAVVNKRAIESMVHCKLTDGHVRAIRNFLENKTGCKITKRKDDFYEMR